MAVAVYDNKAFKAQAGEKVIPGRRLYTNADRTKIVPEGHPEARYLYCNEHKAVPRAELESLLVEERKSEAPEKAEEPDDSPRPRKRKTKSKAATEKAEE